MYGDLAGFPPVLIQAGTNEVLLGDSLLLKKRLEECGVPVTLSVFDGMWHVFHVFDLPETNQAMEQIRVSSIIYSQYKLYTKIKVWHIVLTGFERVFIIGDNKNSSCYILLFAYIFTLFSLSPLPPSRFLTGINLFSTVSCGSRRSWAAPAGCTSFQRRAAFSFYKQILYKSIRMYYY